MPGTGIFGNSHSHNCREFWEWEWKFKKGNYSHYPREFSITHGNEREWESIVCWRWAEIVLKRVTDDFRWYFCTLIFYTISKHCVLYLIISVCLDWLLCLFLQWIIFSSGNGSLLTFRKVESKICFILKIMSDSDDSYTDVEDYMPLVPLDEADR